MRKINHKATDPEILRAYEELRYERLYPKLEIMAYAIRALGYGGVLPVFFLPERVRPTYIKVWMIFAATAIIMDLFLMVFLQPRDRRLMAGLIIVVVIGTAALIITGLIFGMGTLLNKFA